MGLALLSLLLPFGPAYDPWAWLVWGREVSTLELDTGAGPSWKPLPVVVTTVLSPLGPAAPEAWLIVARLAGLAAFALAWRLAGRLAARDPAASPVLAGAVAVAALALLSDPEPPWPRQLVQGTSEPLCAALVLAAIDRHMSRRPGAALALGALAGLVRPEAWPLLAAYAIWAWRAAPRLRAGIAAGAVLVPALWLLPDLWGAGDPLTGGERARVADAPGAPLAALDALAGALGGLLRLVPAPAWIAAAAAVALAIRPPRDRVVLGLAAAAAAWMALAAGTALAGYAGLPRFGVPAAAVAGVLAGVGAARVVSRTRSRALVAAAAVAAAALVAPRVLAVPDDLREAAALARDERDLRAALDRAGGRAAVAACGRPVLGDPLAVPALAWHLGLPLSAPGVGRGPVGPPRVVVARAGGALARGLAGRPGASPLGRAGRWRVIALGCPAAALAARGRAPGGAVG